jgi:hypothetical protein
VLHVAQAAAHIFNALDHPLTWVIAIVGAVLILLLRVAGRHKRH